MVYFKNLFIHQILIYHLSFWVGAFVIPTVLSLFSVHTTSWNYLNLRSHVLESWPHSSGLPCAFLWVTQDFLHVFVYFSSPEEIHVVIMWICMILCHQFIPLCIWGALLCFWFCGNHPSHDSHSGGRRTRHVQVCVMCFTWCCRREQQQINTAKQVRSLGKVKGCFSKEVTSYMSQEKRRAFLVKKRMWEENGGARERGCQCGFRVRGVMWSPCLRLHHQALLEPVHLTPWQPREFIQVYLTVSDAPSRIHGFSQPRIM